MPPTTVEEYDKHLLALNNDIDERKNAIRKLRVERDAAAAVAEAAKALENMSEAQRKAAAQLLTGAGGVPSGEAVKGLKS